MTKMEKRGRASTEKGWERKGYDQKEDKVRNINNKLKKEYAVGMLKCETRTSLYEVQYN